MKLSSAQTASLLLATPATVLARAALPASPITTPASTISLLLPYNGASATYYGSVVSVLPSGIAYAVTCAPLPASATVTEAGDFCGPEFTITQGPHMWEMQYTVAGEGSLSAHCEGNVNTAGPLTCTESAGGPDFTGTMDGGVSTSVLVKSDLESVFNAVTVTAGAEKLTGGGASATASAQQSSETASESKKASSKSTKASLLPLTGTASQTGSATGTGAVATPTGTGAAGINKVQTGAVMGAAGILLAALAL